LDALIWAFGWGKWLFPFILFFWGYMLYDEERFEFRAVNYVGLFLFFLSFHAFLFLFIEADQWRLALSQGLGGGHVGYVLAGNFLSLMGYWASLVSVLGLLIISLLLTLNTTLSALFGREGVMARILVPANFVVSKLMGNRGQDEEEHEDEVEEEEEEHEEEEEEEHTEEDEEHEEETEEEHEEDEESGEEGEEQEEDEEDHAPHGMHGGEEEAPRPASKPADTSAELWWQEKLGIDINLPLGLLSSKKDKPTSGDIKENKEIIRKTLKNFGIPVDMCDVSVGPTITQYTLKPNKGIKLARLVNLSNDLALALAAHPIRIEAPIPGKALVGIEVPNATKAKVGLRGVLNSRKFKENKNGTLLALGRDVAGNAWMDDLSKMPHLLVAGATNSGKSVCLNTIIVSLLFQNSPDDLRFIMVDPKRVELPVYNGIPYLLSPVITDVEKTVNALKWCLNEMDRRFDVLSRTGKRNIQGYNETAKIKMPYIVVIIDELADLMVAAARDIEAGIIRLAQMARAVGIHLIVATQRPSVDVITGLIKANMPARIAFSVASSMDSRTILDSLGAEKLLGKGDMLYMNAGLSKPVRLQGAFVDDLEIKKMMRYIKEKCDEPQYLDGITDKQKVKGIGGAGLGSGGNEDEDEYLYQAKEVVVAMGKASASLLQRKLRVGYARAASLVDALEDAGVVGPANGSKPREVLVTQEQLAAMEEQSVSGVALHSREESEAPDEYFESEDEDEEEGGENEEDEDDNEEDDDGDDSEGDDEEDDCEEDDEEEDDEEDNEDEDHASHRARGEEGGGDDDDEGKYFAR
jgi:S-DNA-T family DNA segregation ATPase FtsK/SpoIIIE